MTEGLSVSGLPAGYEPGRTYELTLTLADSIMAVAGFQAAIRFADGREPGRQAGALETGDPRAARTDSAGVTYAHHRSPAPVTDGRVSWTLAWTAPTEGGAVLLHAVANAANGDDSPLGDLIYLATATSAPRR